MDHMDQKGHILKQWENIYLMGYLQTSETYKLCQRWIEWLYYSSLHKQALDMPLFNCWHSEENPPEAHVAIVPSCTYCFWLPAYSKSQHDGTQYQHLLPVHLSCGAAIHHSRALHKMNNKTRPSKNSSHSLGRRKRRGGGAAGGQEKTCIRLLSTAYQPAILQTVKCFNTAPKKKHKKGERIARWVEKCHISCQTSSIM